MRDFREASKGNISSVASLPAALDALIAGFVLHMESLGLMQSTIAARVRAVRLFCGWCAKEAIEDARAVGRADVDRYLKWLRAQPLAPRTIEHWIAGMRAFFRCLVDTNRLLVSPADHVLLKNLQHLIGPTITAEEANRVLAAPNTSWPIGVRDRAILELLYGTGIRRDELRRLTIFDVDLTGGALRVLGKGGVERMLPLGSKACEWLRTYLENVRQKLIGHKHGRDGEQTLFLEKSGQPMTNYAIGAAVTKHGRVAGVRVSCHALRRTMGTEMLKRGANLASIAKMLGHVHLATTQKYTKVTLVELRGVHDRLFPRGDQ